MWRENCMFEFYVENGLIVRPTISSFTQGAFLVLSLLIHLTLRHFILHSLFKYIHIHKFYVHKYPSQPPPNSQLLNQLPLLSVYIFFVFGCFRCYTCISVLNVCLHACVRMCLHSTNKYVFFTHFSFCGKQQNISLSVGKWLLNRNK